MRRKILGCLFGAACALSASASQAGFVENYSTWQKMGVPGQYFYVMGLFDSETIGNYEEEPDWVNAKRRGLVECVIKMKIGAPALAQAITRYYEEHPRDVAVAADPVFSRVIQDMCLEFINARLASTGTPQWKKSEGSIMDAMRR